MDRKNVARNCSAKRLLISIAAAFILSAAVAGRARAQAAAEGIGEIGAEGFDAAAPMEATDMTMALTPDQTVTLNFSEEHTFITSVIPVQTKAVIASEAKAVIPAEAGIQTTGPRPELPKSVGSGRPKPTDSGSLGRLSPGRLPRARHSDASRNPDYWAPAFAGVTNVKRLVDRSHDFTTDTPASAFEERTLSAMAANRPGGAISQLLNENGSPSRESSSRQAQTPQPQARIITSRTKMLAFGYRGWLEIPKLAKLMRITFKMEGYRAIAYHPSNVENANIALDDARRTNPALVPWPGRFIKARSKFNFLFKIPHRSYLKLLAQGFHPVAESLFHHDFGAHGSSLLSIPPGIWDAIVLRAQALDEASRLGIRSRSFKRALRAEIRRFVNVYDRSSNLFHPIFEDDTDFQERNTRAMVGAATRDTIRKLIDAAGALSMRQRAALEALQERWNSATLSDAQILEQLRIARQARQLAKEQ